jgi:hypothetical protein
LGALLTSIGTATGRPEDQLFQARDATRLSDGTVAVANGGTSEIRLFDSHGNFQRAIGQTGAGPGEFSREDGPGLRFLSHARGDTLLAWDLYRQRLSVFSANGDFIRSVRLRGTSRMYSLRGLFRDRSMLLALTDPDVADRSSSSTNRQVVRLVRFDSRGDSVQLIGDFPGMEFYRTSTAGGPELQILPPWGRELYVAVAAERVYVATGASYEIAAYGGDGTLRQLIRKAHAPLAVTDAVASDLIDRMAEDLVARAPSSLQKTLAPEVRRALTGLRRPKTFPPYKGLVVDAETNLWVREFTTSGDAPRTWSVFAADGRWLGTVTTPAGLQLLEIGSDYVLGRTVDALGVEHIEVYGLEKPRSRLQA